MKTLASLSMQFGILGSICIPCWAQSARLVEALAEGPRSALVITERLPATDDNQSLGSTQTLEEIQGKSIRRAEEEAPVLMVGPAAEPQPALKYRLWQNDFDLKPGSAQLHFYRSLLLWNDLNEDFRAKVELWSAGDEQIPTDQTRREAMDVLQNVFHELHMMAISEDQDWDHRTRDARGLDYFTYLLPDVQQSRSLARALDQRIQYQLSQGDLDGAILSLRDGFRLGAFVGGKSESLVQQLVGIAISGIMLDNVERIMQLPDAPNMYWALATLPRPIIDINYSLQFELTLLHRAFPLLDEAESESRDEEYWSAQWAKIGKEISMVAGDNDPSLGLAIIGVASVGPSRERLIQDGMDAAKVRSMPGMQAVLIDASRSIRRMSDALMKGNLLPGALGKEIIERSEEEFITWTQDSQLKSGAAAMMGLLLPATVAAKESGLRLEYMVNRLMTIEALRAYAAQHDGQLPVSLAKLDPCPALPDPYSGSAFGYELRREGDDQVVTLTGDVPQNASPYREITIRFTKF